VLAAGTAVLAGSALASAVTPAAAAARHLDAASGTALRVTGSVSSRSTYTPARLAALPQTTFRATARKQRVTYSGVALTTVVQDAGPAYPALKNTRNKMLRMTVTVRGASGYTATFAFGELLKDYGSHPAYLAVKQGGRPIAGGAELVVPGDRTTARWIHDVRQVTVGIATAPATSTRPAAGSPVKIIDGDRVVSLSAARLRKLPSRSFRISFSGMKGMESKKEAGPSLLAVLAAGGVQTNANTWVAATGADNYVATFTPDEQLVGGRELRLSLVQNDARLAQPRLVPAGDFYGDRYVSGVVDLYVGTGPAE
jgi:hypothetical protein